MADYTGNRKAVMFRNEHRVLSTPVKVFFVLLLAVPWNATAIHFADRPSRLKYFLHGTPRQIETLLVRSLLETTQGRLDAALGDIDAVIRAVPNFKLAHLVRGDLLQAKARELTGFGNAPDAHDEEIADFRDEARARLERYLSHEDAPSRPNYLWKLEASQRHAIVIDASRSRLYVYSNDNGTARYMADYYITVGKNGSEKQKEGDKRTPLGVYVASRQLPKNKLPDFYGSAAYPLSYPNELDRHQGRNGHGIWLHGTPSSTYSRPPRASDGCVVLTNPDISALAPILDEGNVPVVIASESQLPPAEIHAQREQLMQALEAWRSDWEEQNTEAYLGRYSPDFFSEDKDFKIWAAENAESSR